MKDSPFPPGAPIIGYLRDSGGDKQELSTDKQERQLIAWAKQHGHSITFYRDEARKGSSTVGRDDFERMVNHFRSGATEAGIVLWNFKRFARDIEDHQFYKADIRRRGYIIHAISDPIPEGSVGRLIEFAYEWESQRNLEDLSREVKKGLRDNLLEHGAVPGTPPRGFKGEPIHLPDHRDGTPHVIQKWVPDPSVVPLVQKAFQMRADGATLKHIKAQTNLYKSANSYVTFFSNRLYIGELHYGDHVIKDYCEPIIDLVTFNKVQEIIKRHRHQQHFKPGAHDHPRRKASSFKLSGILYCGICSAPMSGHKSKQRNGSYYIRYECTNAKRNQGCTASRIPAARLEEAVIQTLTEDILVPDYLEAVQAEMLTEIGQNREQFKAERRSLRAQLGQTRKKISYTVNAISDAGHSRALLEQLQTLESMELQHQANIAILDQKIADPISHTKQEITVRAETLIENLRKSSPAEFRHHLRGLVLRITAYRDEREIIGYLTFLYPLPDVKKNSDIESVPKGDPAVGAQKISR